MAAQDEPTVKQNPFSFESEGGPGEEEAVSSSRKRSRASFLEPGEPSGPVRLTLSGEGNEG